MDPKPSEQKVDAEAQPKRKGEDVSETQKRPRKRQKIDLIEQCIKFAEAAEQAQKEMQQQAAAIRLDQSDKISHGFRALAAISAMKDADSTVVQMMRDISKELEYTSQDLENAHKTYYQQSS